MSDRQVCPICGMTLHNCFHSIEEMMKLCKNNLELSQGECKAWIKESDALRAKLDVAREALEKIPHMGFPDEREYHPWYPNCAGCIAEEALQKIKE